MHLLLLSCSKTGVKTIQNLSKTVRTVQVREKTVETKITKYYWEEMEIKSQSSILPIAHNNEDAAYII